MASNLNAITLELVDDVLAELEDLAPVLEELAERAGAVLNVSTWDETTEEAPAAVLRLHGTLRRLSGVLEAAAA